MTEKAYYNEHDPFAAQWLRELIKAGHIAPGDVDERSIEDVTPNELKSYTQCHFFAGIGGWSLALRYAGWPEDRPVWTGSAPCQPFSTAGQGAGFNDERHLWPAFFWLIRQCQPPTIFGEQVGGKLGFEWWDLVADDLESQGYAATAFDLPAAAVGTPHKRQRLYWVAHSERNGRGRGSNGNTAGKNGSLQTERLRTPGGNLANTHEDRRIGQGAFRANEEGRKQGPQQNGIVHYGLERSGFNDGWYWHECTDGKFRPVPAEPSLFPLAYGVPSRVGQLRGYGNAIVPQVGAAFVQAFMEVCDAQ